MIGCSYRELKGKRTIITGDIGSGKTVLTRKLLREALESGEAVTVIDFAPKARIINGVKVGGFLVDGETDCRVLRSENISTPRLSASDADELVKLADLNAKITLDMLAEFIGDPTQVLVINDTSIHLQSGDIEPLFLAIEKSETVILNGYIGEYLKEDHGTGISNREKELMKILAQSMDGEIKL